MHKSRDNHVRCSVLHWQWPLHTRHHRVAMSSQSTIPHNEPKQSQLPDNLAPKPSLPTSFWLLTADKQSGRALHHMWCRPVPSISRLLHVKSCPRTGAFTRQHHNGSLLAKFVSYKLSVWWLAYLMLNTQVQQELQYGSARSHREYVVCGYSFCVGRGC